MSTPAAARRRATYHHGDLRRALLDAGTAAVRADGPGALSLREVAREAGVSPNAVYRHFAGHADLLAGVAEGARHAMGAEMLARLDGVELPRRATPVEVARARLAAVGRGYVEYAVAEPGLFRVAFGSPPPAHGTVSAKPVDDLDPWHLLQEALDEVDRAGGLAPGTRSQAATSAWAGVHGLATLLVDGPLVDLPPAGREAALTHLLAVVGAGLAAPGHPGAHAPGAGS